MQVTCQGALSILRETPRTVLDKRSEIWVYLVCSLTEYKGPETKTHVRGA